ncbi:MAG: hypothetical protein U0800_07545 [Isosphaeraceae bacterium]
MAHRELAVAEARAVEEGRRRRVQLGLAACRRARLPLGGPGTTYYLQRAEQAAAVERVVGQAVTLRDQAGRYPDDLVRWQVALAAVKQAEAAGDEAAAPRLLALREEIRAGLDAAQADRDLVARLVDIRGARADDPDGLATDAAYADAFRARASTRTMATRRPPAPRSPAGRRRRPRAGRALDGWAGVRRDREAKEPAGGGCWRWARAADPDPDRDASARRPPAGGYKAVRLCPTRAAGRPGRRRLLGPSSLVLGGPLADAGDVAAGLAVLRRASWAHPEDGRTHHALGRLLERGEAPRPDEAIRALSVAWARQPELAGHDLAHALERRGRAAEAEPVQARPGGTSAR